MNVKDLLGSEGSGIRVVGRGEILLLVCDRYGCEFVDE